jgi:hypothetical protein
MSGTVSTVVEWDGEALVGWVAINGVVTKVRATREIIHDHAPGFNDAVSWEIERHRAQIFEMLAPFLIEANRKHVGGM